jgi:aldose 1-epimerase
MTLQLEHQLFGTLADGSAVDAFTLTNGSRMRARIITYGAALQSLWAPDAAGTLADIVLGYPDLESYVHKPEYLGTSIGRVANRIAKGAFTLDGRTYNTTRNEGEHTLHGGAQGFDKVLWRVVATSGNVPPGGSALANGAASVALEYTSPDGDQGFPGTLTTTVIYALNEQNELLIDYRAITDKPTVVNLTHHALWNLAGEGSNEGALGQWMMIPADRYTPVDATLIPTGELRSVAGTVFDFRITKPIVRDVRDARDEQVERGRGFDHNFVISDAPVIEPHLVARAEHRESGRILEVLSNQPGLQFYSGNFLNGTRAGKSGRLYRQGDGFALEPQAFPDTPNHPAFGSIRLGPGQEYRNLIVYRLSVRREPSE